MKTSTTAATLALAANVAAFWRMPCRSHTGIARIDPLVAPNNVGDHSHIVFGSGGFSPNSTYEDLVDSECTTCDVTKDKSAYWTPPLYFQHEDGTTEMVPNVGGMLAYYLFYLNGGNVTAFPEGFQMIAGDPHRRKFDGPENPGDDLPLSDWNPDPVDQDWLEQRAIGFNCLNYAKKPAEGSLYRHVIPKKEWMDANCPDGLRLEMAFPSCGNGELDSPDHKSHMKYPHLVKEGNCPEGYDVKHPFIFFETIFATQKFAGVPGQFVLSTGDPTGQSYHADFIMGWESAGFLQNAIDDCKNPSGKIEDCPHFDTCRQNDLAAQCAFNMPEANKGDDCQGPRDGLPVGVPIQSGPERATKYPVHGAHGGPTGLLPDLGLPTGFPFGGLGSHEKPSDKPVSAAAGKAKEHVSSVPAPPSAAPAPVSPVTEAPSYATASVDDDVLSTTYITKGHEVVEMVIEQTDVTVTATATATGYGSAHKRHLEKHAHRHIHI